MNNSLKIFFRPVVAYIWFSIGVSGLLGIDVHENTFIVNNTNNNGAGSLRQAIRDANSHAGVDTIIFNIPNTGPHSIRPETALPEITDPIVIDGTTQPGFVGSPVIELNGSNAGDNASGLTIRTGDCTVRGLVINRFKKNGIHLDGNDGNHLEGNYIGTDVTGTVAFGNSGSGIVIERGSQFNTIGGNQESKRNVISGNSFRGVWLLSSNNNVAGNYIGTNLDGTAALGNTGDGLVCESGTRSNTIGGVVNGERNIISGNEQAGLWIIGNENRILGNYIGTDVTGAIDLGNHTFGIFLSGGFNIIGGTTASARNVISSNGEKGIGLIGANATDNKIQGNFIGMDISGRFDLGNSLMGVLIDQGASNNLIGGSAQGAGNIISGNNDDGICIVGATTLDNRIISNSIFSNSGIGIDLAGDNRTSNDAGDADSGPNNLQNYPEITLAGIRSNRELIISYRVDSDVDNSAYPLSVQFFESDGSGEGKKILGEDIYSVSDISQNRKFVNLGDSTEIHQNSYLVATATDANGNTSEFSNQVLVDTLTDSSPPAIQISDAPVETVVNSSITISVGVTDDFFIQSVALLYRQGGEASFTSAEMTPNAGKYQATIPALNISTTGIEYFIEAFDGLFNYSKTDLQAILVRLPDDFLSKNHQGGFAGDSYRLISIPLQLDNPSVTASLLDDLGAADNLQWRLWDIDPQRRDSLFPYREYPNVSSLAPGGSMFLIALESKTLTSGTGLTIDSTVPFAISLQQGWNMIASPFNFEIPLQNIEPENLRGQIYSYKGNWTSAPANLKPWEGYLVKVTSTTTLTINPRVGGSTLSKLDAQNLGFDTQPDWFIQIQAESGPARDRDNFAGVFSDANLEWDHHERFEPPPIGDFVMLSFPQRHWQRLPDIYTTDFRPYSAEGYVWNFTVESYSANKPVKLTFNNIETVPAEFEIRLIDLNLGIIRDLAGANNYSFRSTHFGRPKRFRLLVGVAEFIAEKNRDVPTMPAQYLLEQNFPNPFNPGTSIKFGLPGPGKVFLKVFNILGQEVARLIDGIEKPAGFYVADWDGKDKLGNVVPGGIYFYRLRVGPVVLTKQMTLIH